MSTTFETIEIECLGDITGGARKRTPKKKPLPEPAFNPRPFPGGGNVAIDGLGQMRINDFCRREPFACANMRSGGNI